ncbi:hypothetical protein [Polyangium spumosum]|uniref:hypothetical protein n=1 Tax=Polyangium spumosum TaxID=889282 RepID=UPI00198056BC|nr:hypothetical protein [Polyangium spumosum]
MPAPRRWTSSPSSRPRSILPKPLFLVRRDGVAFNGSTQVGFTLSEINPPLAQDIATLDVELASLLDHFGAQADDVVDLVTGEARAAGFSPDDPNEYGLSPSQTPWVEVPDVSGVAGAFDPGKDPYAAYADAVIAALSEDVLGNVVVNRADFATHVRAWRANMAAIEKALLARMSVSQAETAAFLNAQIRVTNHVKQFMDASDWFLDSPVPADLRAQVDGVLRTAFGPLAEEMKDNLNQWDGFTLNLEETQLVETIRAFAGAVSAVDGVVGPYVEVMQTLVHATTRIGIGFVPYVGPALDLCEAVTGKRFCLPGGEELSTEERIFSGVGFGFGKITKAWAGIKASGVKPGAKIVAAGMVGYTDEFLEALKQSRRMKYKSLDGAMKGAVGTIANEFEGRAGLYLMKDEGRAMIGVGDDGVRKVLGIPKPKGSLPEGIAQAPDFLTVTKGNKLALSEAKGGQVNGGEVVGQLTNAMKTLKKLGLDGDVARVELIMSKVGTMNDHAFKVVNNVLVDPLEGNKPVLIDGTNHLIHVIKL